MEKNYNHFNLTDQLYRVKSTTVGAVLTTMIQSGLNSCTYIFTSTMSTSEKQSYINNALRLNTNNSAGVTFKFEDGIHDEEDALIFENFTYPINIIGCEEDELLEEELAENVLFRLPNNKFTNEIDGVFNALESESHLILVTSEKMKESLFSKLKQQKGNTKESNTAKADDDFKF